MGAADGTGYQDRMPASMLYQADGTQSPGSAVVPTAEQAAVGATTETYVRTAEERAVEATRDTYRTESPLVGAVKEDITSPGHSVYRL